jgi:hypothetical protein
VENLEQRIVAIEKSNRHWKLGNAAVGMALLLVVAVAAEKAPQIPEVVIARKFVALNERGEPVAVLGHTKNVGIIGVSDCDGNMVFAASANDEGDGVVTTYDGAGHELVTLGVDKSGLGKVTTHHRGATTTVAKKGKPVESVAARKGG